MRPQRARSSAAALHPHFADVLRRCSLHAVHVADFHFMLTMCRRAAHAAIARFCLPSVTLPASAATDIANEIKGAISTNRSRSLPACFSSHDFIASACNSGLKVLHEDIVMPVVDAVKKELVKGGKCPASEFVPERERDRLRGDTASKVSGVLASYSAHVPRAAADIITGDAGSCAHLNTAFC